MWGLMRINRFLAAAGLGSRRNCEELVRNGRVTINGKVCENLATEVSDEDFVKVGSKRVQADKHLYVLLHKPRGYISTASDTHERKTIFDLLPGQWPRLFHVGRLDRDSEGLLILTNDGDFGLWLTHPRFKAEKEYEVLLDKPFDVVADKPRLLQGVNIEGGRASAESVRMLGPKLLRIVLRQGLKRQIRLMLYKIGYEVERLIRVRIGGVWLDELRAGEWRILTSGEVAALSAPAKESGKRADVPKTKAKAPATAAGRRVGETPKRDGAAPRREGGKPRREGGKPRREGKVTSAKGARREGSERREPLRGGRGGRGSSARELTRDKAPRHKSGGRSSAAGRGRVSGRRGV
jgi:23S rRNA pseudouridine2605 synthase